LQDGLKKAEGSITATSAANNSLRETVNQQEDAIAELSAQKTMLTTERDALLEHKRQLKTQLEEIKSTSHSRQSELDEKNTDLESNL
jgi:predicted  nucleic acid-binding Zn-ribbon protein